MLIRESEVAAGADKKREPSKAGNKRAGLQINSRAGMNGVAAVGAGKDMSKGLNILLVDDDPNYSALILGALKEEYPQLLLTTVDNQESFERAMEEGRFNMVLTEFKLPWIAGAQVLSRVREKWPEIPVIMMSAAANEREIVETLEVGLDNFALKTSGFDARLRAAVRGLVERAETLTRAGRTERRLSKLLTRLTVGVFRTTGAGRIVEANPAFLKLLGFSSLEEAKSINMRHLYARPEDRGRLLDRMKDHGQVKEAEVQMRRVDGEVIWVQMTKTIGSSPDGELTFDGLVEDITARKSAAEALRESEERYALAANGASDGLWDWNLLKDEVYFSPRWKSMLGYEDSEIGTSPEEWFTRVDPDDRKTLSAAIEAHIQGIKAHLEVEYRIRHKDGNKLWVLCRGLAVRDAEGKPYRMAGSQTDVTDRKTSEEQLKHDSFYDGLSGLPNRFLFMDRLGNALLRAKRGGNYAFGILVLDLDRFQFVNDSLGHVVGDQLIIAMAHRLKSCLRPGDTMARLGGDEFAILLEDIKDAEDATRVADRIHKDLEKPFDLCGHEIFATTSIGIALSATGYDQAEVMLRDADTAMHRAKSLGRARHEVFNASMHARAVSLLKLEGDLRRALERQEFRIHYQPIVSLESWKIAGFEALLRWQHPERGLVLPEEFIPLAEDTGLIIPLAKWVIQEACRQTSVWQSDFPANPPISVSVNLSSKNLSQPDLIEEVDRALTEAGLLGQSLGLEITESALIENAEHAITVLSRLRALNIRMHVDDFGTGYSSLSYLHQFPIDSLKIDRSFVTRLPEDGQNAEIVRTIMSLARNLGLTVIAEGVETREQAESLRELDCEMAQGFFFHKPLDSEQIKALLKAKWRTYIV